MSMEKKHPTPFELILSTKDHDTNKELFINTVEKVLNTELQNSQAFGCKISDCHTHVGSKKHLGFFVEAELLFHNSYYNKGFAYLTAKKVLQYVEENKKNRFDRVWLIGYETFSELFLCETQDLLNNAGLQTHYCVFETVGQDKKYLRGLKELVPKGVDNTLIVFIVPIATTLTTHDKLISAFWDEIKEIMRDVKVDILRTQAMNFGLIIIGQDENLGAYWRRNKSKRTLMPVLSGQKQFEKLETEVFYFAYVDSPWHNAEECIYCFPDLIKKSILDEKPIFEVNRASVVPMLQLKAHTLPAPREVPWKQSDAEANIGRVIRLSQYMHHHHLLRNGNHYQYYFDTDRYFKTERVWVEDWLDQVVRGQLSATGNYNKAIYNIIVAPRHSSNADFLHSVNNKVFNGAARIFYFDVQREYRGNVEAKYSDFTSFVRNIAECKTPFEIRYHYVDDCIYMGQNFARTKSLIHSLTGKSDDKNILLFYSIILLLGRNSDGTKKYILPNTQNFFEYVHLSISPMRSHEDACTLCQLVQNFQKMSDNCSTNEMSVFCMDKVEVHREEPYSKYLDKEYASFEKRMRLILRHMINERLCNRWTLHPGTVNNPEKIVRAENSEDIYWVLESFYRDLTKKTGKVAEVYTTANTSNIRFSTEEAQIAFFKVISRPFFTYDIRQKQASFRFCIKKLDNLLRKKTVTKQEKTHIVTLINALADMDANYLLRAEFINLLFFGKTRYGNSVYESYFKAVKKVTTISRNAAKSMLLENILVTGGEHNYFSARDLGGQLQTAFGLKNWLWLYLENTRVIKDGFEDIYRSREYTILENPPYYLRQLQSLFVLNDGGKGNKTKRVNDYCDLKSKLKIQTEVDPSKYFFEIAALVGSLLQVQDTAAKQPRLFIRSFRGNETQNILLCGNNDVHNMFMTDAFQNKLNKMLDSKESERIADTLFYHNNVNACVVKFEKKFSLGDTQEQSQKKIDMGQIKPVTPEALYVFIPLDESIPEMWQKVQSMDKRNSPFIRFLFGVKLLLSLRKEFVEMIQRNFGNDTIHQLLLQEERTQALSISKASRHGVARYYSTINYGKIEDKLQDPLYKNLLDNYVQVLANDFISSLYRDANSGKLRAVEKNGGNVGYEIIDPGTGEMGIKRIYHLLLGKYDDRFQQYHYEMFGPCRVGNNSFQSKGIEIVIKLAKEEHWNLKYIERDDSAISPFLLIVFLLATNARYHAPADKSKVTVTVSREGDYLCVSNYTKGAKQIVADVNKQIQHPPHRLDKKSITLWSLNRYCMAVNNLSPEAKNSGDQTVFTIESPRCNVFQVRLKLFD